MIESQSDFKLMASCAGMIQNHCGGSLASSSTLLECLRRASKDFGDLFDPDCRRFVQKRLLTQRLDSRLNPRLTANCR